jgi:hypothetical protein
MNEILDFMDKQVEVNDALIENTRIMYNQLIKLTEEITRLKSILEENGITQ